MGGSHEHSGHDHVETATVPRLLLLGGLALAAIATVIGLFELWPDDDQPKTPYAAEGVTFPEAEVVTVHEQCPVIVFDPADPSAEPAPEFPAKCSQLTVEVDGREHLANAEPGQTVGLEE